MNSNVAKTMTTPTERLVRRDVTRPHGKVCRVFYTEVSSIPFRLTKHLHTPNSVDWFMPQDIAARFIDTLAAREVPVWSHHHSPQERIAPTSLGFVWMVRAGFTTISGRQVITWMELYAYVDDNSCPVGGGWSFWVDFNDGNYVDDIHEISFTRIPRITSCTIVDGVDWAQQNPKSPVNFSLVRSENRRETSTTKHSHNMSDQPQQVPPSVTEAKPNVNHMFSAQEPSPDASAEELRTQLAFANEKLQLLTSPGGATMYTMFSQFSAGTPDAAALPMMPEMMSGQEALELAAVVALGARAASTGGSLSDTAKSLDGFFSRVKKHKGEQTVTATKTDLVDIKGAPVTKATFSSTKREPSKWDIFG